LRTCQSLRSLLEPGRLARQPKLGLDLAHNGLATAEHGGVNDSLPLVAPGCPRGGVYCRYRGRIGVLAVIYHPATESPLAFNESGCAPASNKTKGCQPSRLSEANPALNVFDVGQKGACIRPQNDLPASCPNASDTVTPAGVNLRGEGDGGSSCHRAAFYVSCNGVVAFNILLFDHRARKIGFDIYVDGLCQVVHEGFIGFPFTSNMPVFDKLTVDEIHNLAVSLGNDSVKDQEGLTRVAV